MKKVALSLDSSLKEIFTYEESRAVFDKFLPGMRTMAEKQPAARGFSVRKIIQFSGGAIPDEAADALDAALCAEITKDRDVVKRCSECGAAFMPKSNRAKYCPACAKRMRRRKEAERQRKRYWQSTHLGP